MPLLIAPAGWVDALLAGLLGFTLRATVLLAAAWLATRLLHRASAAARHLIWTSAIIGVLVLPVLTEALPSWNVPVVSIAARTDMSPGTTNSAPVTVASGQSSFSREREETPSPGAAAPAVAAEPVTSRAIAFPRVTGPMAFVVAWLVIASLMLARLAIASVRVSYWQRNSRPVEDARWLTLLRRLAREYRIERPVALLENGQTDVPVTWGTIYPVILLPGTADQWDDEQRVAVLTHELAHVKRFDALSQLIAQLALALLWFHPLVWLAVRKMRLEREHACDDFVLATGTRASRYADDLLGLARRLGRHTPPAAAALAMARRSELEGRLLAILDPAMKRTAVRRARVAGLGLVVMVFVAPLAAFRPAARVGTVPVSDLKQVETGSDRAPEVVSASVVQSSASAPQLRLPEIGGAIGRFGVLSSPKLQAVTRVPDVRIVPDTEPPPAVDIETLIAVARASKRMTNDFEKGQVLAMVARRYQQNDSLREAYIDAALSITSDHERTKALIALLGRDSLPAASTARVLRSALSMSSDMSRATVLRRISPSTFADTVVQRAYLDVITGMSSNTERANAISSLVKQRPLTPAVQSGLIRAIAAITSNTEKANALMFFANHQGIADETVRRAFLRAAETLTSDYDYRRVISAVVR